MLSGRDIEKAGIFCESNMSFLIKRIKKSAVKKHNEFPPHFLFMED
ncbi:hypothetical protein SC1083_1078 [Aggregatibacter actinomycetemcomitans serotype e str. SC1083]|uniref:Uncharacterized protein n=1 Tax=Aggregatibacter actinomycetemcomitans serotype e str. SC1083 TaxID=907488 RepID=G4A8D1_AGGAC|nr:hypothetical protein SC1083_1078 [Aggregatibacter actinomycetemcomitans serotype e str. SC1083]